jgi:hypothetical protein
VKVGTHHRIKGLEFKQVFLPFLSSTRFPVIPAGVKDPDERREHEERSLSQLFVALTRARDQLVVTCTGDPADAIIEVQDNGVDTVRAWLSFTLGPNLENLVLRGALAQPSAQAAIEFIKNVPHASGQHYAVVGHDAEGSVVSTSLECSAFGAVASAPNGHSCAHTNHPLATQDIDPTMSPTESRSELRLSVLNDRLAQVKTIGDLTDLLSVPPICVDRSDSDWFTFGAIAVELGTTPTMRYTLGPPSTEPWTLA